MTKKTKLTNQQIEELDLINDSIIQSVIIKLNAEVPRELRFRQFLDANRKDGLDMKETILRLFEFKDNNIIPQKTYTNHKSVKVTEQIDEVSENDFDCI